MRLKRGSEPLLLDISLRAEQSSKVSTSFGLVGAVPV